MVKIVTGKINSSKTTKALHIYNYSKLGDGFLSIKNMENDLVLSYDAQRLSTHEKRRLIVHQKHSKESFTSYQSLGPYLFNLDTICWIETCVDQFIFNQTSPIYLDEIGLLELQGNGFDSILRKLLSTNIDLILVIREDLIEKVISHYEIKAYEIID